MKSNYPLIVFFVLTLLLAIGCSSQENNQHKSQNPSKEKSNMQQILIDKFIVPAEAKNEFLGRMRKNLETIKKQPGSVETSAYEKTGGDGEVNYVTIAVWENEDALARAKQAVSAEYQKQGFNLQEMLKRLNIKIDRAVYKKLAD